MSPAMGGASVHYFDAPIDNGATGHPNQVSNDLQVQLSADVKS
jgi:hypothetical protein